MTVVLNREEKRQRLRKTATVHGGMAARGIYRPVGYRVISDMVVSGQRVHAASMIITRVFSIHESRLSDGPEQNGGAGGACMSCRCRGWVRAKTRMQTRMQTRMRMGVQTAEYLSSIAKRKYNRYKGWHPIRRLLDGRRLQICRAT